MREIRGILSEVWVFRQTLVVVLTPLLLLPLLLFLPGQEPKAAYGLLIMAVYWVTETIPLPVTALLPMVIFPLVGLMKAGDLSVEYLKDTNMLFIGGFMIAVAVERWNLHKRIALRVLLLVGPEPKWLMLGFMLPSAFLSMWISNTATTAMMVPIAQAVVDQLIKSRQKKKSQPFNGETGGNTAYICMTDGGKQLGDDLEDGDARDFQMQMVTKMAQQNSDSKSPGVFPPVEDNNYDGEYSNLKKAMMLCVAYSATCGGVATLTGTGTNLVLKGHTDSFFGDAAGINFTSWFVFAFPCSCLSLLACYLWLQVYFLGFRNSIFFCKKKTEEAEKAKKGTELLLRTELEQLGPVAFAEVMVALHFVALALLWLTRESDFFTGWGSLIPEGYATDSTPAILLCISLFVFPARRPNFLCLRSKTDSSVPGPKPALLDWNTVSTKFAWGILFLMGGGYALAKACKKSGLSEVIADELIVFRYVPPWALCIIITTLMAAITEVTSNVAIASIFLPILSQLSIGIGVNPLYLLIPGCMATSFAFMLPVATPPNAIVFSYGTVQVLDMAKAGIMLNIICIAIVNLAINTWGTTYFRLDIFPDWANTTITTLSVNNASCGSSS